MTALSHQRNQHEDGEYFVRKQYDQKNGYVLLIAQQGSKKNVPGEIEYTDTPQGDAAANNRVKVLNDQRIQWLREQRESR